MKSPNQITLVGMGLKYGENSGMASFLSQDQLGAFSGVAHPGT